MQRSGRKPAGAPRQKLAVLDLKRATAVGVRMARLRYGKALPSALLRCAVLCCAVLYCAALRHMLFCAVLLYAMLICLQSCTVERHDVQWRRAHSQLQS